MFNVPLAAVAFCPTVQLSISGPNAGNLSRRDKCVTRMANKIVTEGKAAAQAVPTPEPVQAPTVQRETLETQPAPSPAVIEHVKATAAKKTSKPKAAKPAAATKPAKAPAKPRAKKATVQADPVKTQVEPGSEETSSIL